MDPEPRAGLCAARYPGPRPRSGILERTLNFDSITGRRWNYATRRCQALSRCSLDGGQHGLHVHSTNTLHLASEQSNVSVRYQTTALAATGLVIRKPYYTPYLYEARFERL